MKLQKHGTERCAVKDLSFQSLWYRTFVFIVTNTFHGNLYDDGVAIDPSITLKWVEIHIYLFIYLLPVAAYQDINYRLSGKV